MVNLLRSDPNAENFINMFLCNNVVALVAARNVQEQKMYVSISYR